MSTLQLRQLVGAAKPQPPSAGAPPRVESALREIDLGALAGLAPEPPGFLIPDWLPQGEVTLLAGNGGAGKSAIALQLAVAVALGSEFYGLRTERRYVSYVSFEDSEAVLHWRLARICESIGIKIQTLQGCLRLFDGTTSATAWYSRAEFGDHGLTPDFAAMAERMKGSQLVIVDGSSDVYAGNENDRAQVKAFLRGLRTLIPPDGALLLLAHVDKQGAKAGASSLGFSGSTGWNNGVRCRWYLYPETEGSDGEETETGNVIMEVRKSNLGRTGASMKLRFNPESGVFARIDIVAPMARKSTLLRDAEEQSLVLSIIRKAYAADNAVPAATCGIRTAHHVCAAQEGFPDALKGKRGRSRFYEHIERLRATGQVTEETQKRASRNTAQVLRAA